MKISLDENYYARTDVTTLGYVGETNARIIAIEGYQCNGADSYKMRLSYPDNVAYDVDISGGTYTIDGSILRRVGDVYVQILACRQNGDTYEYVKKSNILTLHICRSLNGNVASVPTYEQSVGALEKLFEIDKKITNSADALDDAITAANTAKTDLQTVTDVANTALAEVKKTTANASTAKAELESATANANTAKSNLDAAKSNAETALSNLNTAIAQAETSDSNLTATISNAETVKTQLSDVIANANSMNTTLAETISTATDLYTSLSAENVTATENISKLTEENAKAEGLYMKADGIVCKSEGSAIVLNDSSELPFSGMRIFGRSEQDGTPSPDNPVPIVSVGGSGNIDVDVRGGNLFDAQKIVPNSASDVSAQGTRLELINKIGGAYRSSKCDIYGDFSNIELTLSANITASGNADGCVSVRFYSNGTEINGYRSRLDLYNSGTKTKTAPAGTDRIRIVVYSSYQKNASVGDTVVYDNIMLNMGSAALPYEPYKHQSITLSTPNGLPGIPVDSGGNYTDDNGQQWVCDEIDLGRGVYVQRIGRFNDNFDNMKLISYGNNLFSTEIITNIKRRSGLLCNIFKNGNTVNEMYVVSTLRGSSDKIYFSVPADTVDDVKTLLGNKDMEAIYELETPIETPLTDDQLTAYRALHTNKPTTTVINSDAAHMAVGYTADTKTYIDNKFAELQAALISTGGNV